MSEHNLPAGEAKREMSEPSVGTVRCSFCGLNEDVCGMLISSPKAESPRCLICDECIMICIDLLIDRGIAGYECDLRRIGKGPTLPIVPKTANATPEKTEPDSAGGKS
jgi:hypothetical protein